MPLPAPPAGAHEGRSYKAGKTFCAAIVCTTLAGRKRRCRGGLKASPTFRGLDKHMSVTMGVPFPSSP